MLFIDRHCDLILAQLFAGFGLTNFWLGKAGWRSLTLPGGSQSIAAMERRNRTIDTLGSL